MCVKNPLTPQHPPACSVTMPLAVDQPLLNQYSRAQTDLSNAPAIARRQGSGNLFDHVYPQVGKNTGWTLTDVQRPLPPWIQKRPNCMLNTDFASLIGPPEITQSPHGNQVWQNTEQARLLSQTYTKTNSGSGALNYYNLFPDAVATGGGGDMCNKQIPNLSNVYGFTFRGVGNSIKIRAMPTWNNYHHEVIDGRTRLADKAYAKPGSLMAQERSQLGILSVPKNSDLFEIPWRTMLPSKNLSAGWPADPAEVVMNPMRRCWDDSYGLQGWQAPKGPDHGEKPFYRGQDFSKVETKQNVVTGYLHHQGGAPYGDWTSNDALDTRLAKQEFTQWASRPPNPGFIGGMEFVADSDKRVRNLPARPRHTKREEHLDYEFCRFKVPEVSYAMQYNQTFPYYGDRRKGPEMQIEPDNAILATRARNPFAIPLNPYERYMK